MWTDNSNGMKQLLQVAVLCTYDTVGPSNEQLPSRVWAKLVAVRWQKDPRKEIAQAEA